MLVYLTIQPIRRVPSYLDIRIRYNSRRSKDRRSPHRRAEPKPLGQSPGRISERISETGIRHSRAFEV